MHYPEKQTTKHLPHSSPTKKDVELYKEKILKQQIESKKRSPEKEVIAKDFFGRPIQKKKQPAQVEETKPIKPLESHFRFKYNEGFTDGVKRTVYVKDWL